MYKLKIKSPLKSFCLIKKNVFKLGLGPIQSLPNYEKTEALYCFVVEKDTVILYDTVQKINYKVLI